MPNIAKTVCGGSCEDSWIGYDLAHRPLPKYHNWLNKNVKDVTPPTTVKIAWFDNDHSGLVSKGGVPKLPLDLQGQIRQLIIKCNASNNKV